MNTYSFKNDYSEGAHPNILAALGKTNMEQTGGYGTDTYCTQAAELIKEKMNAADADVHFITGGTQANLTVISTALKPYESVIAAETGHINVHEAGSIEATGHKVCIAPGSDGKISPEGVAEVLSKHTDEHMVKPAMVYISNSTEIGSIYTKKELQELSEFCTEKKLLLFLDGARLGSALTSHKNDLTLEDIAKLTDAFYIGGTKNGALLGEAIVITNDTLKENFRYSIKQKGGLLAKGRLLGIQFQELFSNNLFFELASHANIIAQKMVEGLKKQGYNFLTEPVSNQIFPILPNDHIKKLEEHFGFYVWKKIDEEKSAIRLVTSWATPDEAAEKLIGVLEEIR